MDVLSQTPSATPPSPGKGRRQARALGQDASAPSSSALPRSFTMPSSPRTAPSSSAFEAGSRGRLRKYPTALSHAPNSMSRLPSLELSSPSDHPVDQKSLPPMAHGDYFFSMAAPSKSSTTAKTKTKIKPILKKLTTQEPNAVDLARSVTDHDGLALYTSDGKSGSRSAANISLTSAGRRDFSHNRSTSVTSQFSTTTAGSANRQYVHPMRQTPRPFTPPIAQSYANSLLGSEVSGEAAEGGHYDEDRLRQIARTGSPLVGLNNSSSHLPPSRIHVDTSTSARGLAIESETNLAGTPSSFLPRAGAMSPAGTVSPTSRSSLDMPFKLRRKTSSDPASRAASIQAARQAFSEREAAKAEKAEREELRRHQRKEKRDNSRRRKSDSKEAGSSSRPSGLNEKGETLKGSAYSHMPSRHGTGDTGRRTGGGPRPGRHNTATSTSSTVKSTWVGFMVWLKTRILNLGRRMRSKS